MKYKVVYDCIIYILYCILGQVLLNFPPSNFTKIPSQVLASFNDYIRTAGRTELFS